MAILSSHVSVATGAVIIWNGDPAHGNTGLVLYGFHMSFHGWNRLKLV